ncbi:MAG: GNAT family N-acetyltransferase, partial [Gammaproteobacteria bacterium]|nr:GNAT family N-acetyltransferase [Gammaproteobacteria bacterium]
MKFVCYSNWDQLPESANALFEQAEKDSIFFSRPWFENVDAAAVGNVGDNDKDKTLALACVLAESTVLAILPLVRNASNSGYSLKHRYTPVYSLLMVDENQEQVLACLGQGLNQLPLNGLLLEPVAGNDTKLDGLQRVMEAAGFSCHHAFRFYNWI